MRYPITAARTTHPHELPAIVFIHGMRTSSAIWEHQLEHVHTLGHHAVAVDLPAHGIRHGQRFSLPAAFDVIDEAVATLGPTRPVALVGLSLGGYTALAWAGRRPANLVGVLAAACTANPKGKPVGVYRDIARVMVAGRDAVLGGARQVAGTWRAGFTGGRSTPGGVGMPLAWHGAPPTETPTPWSIVTDALGELAGVSWLDHLRQIQVPVWFVNGARDTLRIDERRYLRAAGRGSLVVVPGAGHDVNSHAPGRFNQAMTQALAEFGGGTLRG